MYYTTTGRRLELQCNTEPSHTNYSSHVHASFEFIHQKNMSRLILEKNIIKTINQSPHAKI